MPVAGGYRVTASWPSASGCDLGTHHMGSAMVTGADGKPTTQVIQVVLERSQYRIVDDWHVMGMQGTGSKRIVAEDAFVPAQRTIFAVAPGRGSEPAQRPGLHANPMYLGRIASFLIAESAAVAVGAARGALDLYEEVLRVKRTYHPPYHERFRRAGGPGPFRPRARPGLDRRGGADPRRPKNTWSTRTRRRRASRSATRRTSA